MMSGVYVVIGAKGGTGRQLVHRLAERSSAEVSEIRALVRDPSTVAADALPTDERVKLLREGSGGVYPTPLQFLACF